MVAIRKEMLHPDGRVSVWLKDGTEVKVWPIDAKEYARDLGATLKPPVKGGQKSEPPKQPAPKVVAPTPKKPGE